MKQRQTRTRVLSLILGLVMALSRLPVSVLAADGQPAVSSNKNKQDYTTWSTTVKSYLYENQSGGLTRVEYLNNQVVIEDYDSDFKYLSGRTIAPELPLWGGFYAGKDYNFLVYGQNNKSESDSAEVIRVVKYDKDWNRLGQASLNGANTTVPFDAGSLRCDEYDGYLYIRTCHEMYKSSDGYNHQSNLTMAVRQSDMTITDSYYKVMNSSYGYISHSFNQFIIVDEDGKIVALDHGDAYPRGVAFSKYYADAGTGKFSGSGYGAWCSAGTMVEFAGSVGQNTTGASVGGLAETTDCYIMTYNYDGQGSRGDRYPYYHWMDKATGKSWSAQLTQTPGSTTPVLAPMGLNGGFLLWNGKSGSTVDDTLYYLHYGANGQPEQFQTTTGSLSGCQPIYYNGKAVWYVTDNSAPVFYLLDASGVATVSAEGGTATPPADPCADGHTWQTLTTPATCQKEGQTSRTCLVCGEKEVTAIPKLSHTWEQKTIPATSTTPGRVYQVCTACGTEETLSAIPVTPANPITFLDVKKGDWFEPYVTKATELGVISGIGDNLYDPEGKVTYAHMATLMIRLMHPGDEKGYSGGQWWEPYAKAADAHGLWASTAMEDQSKWSDLAGQPIPRAQMAQVVYNAMKETGVRMPTASEQDAAKVKIKDFANIPSVNRTATLSCYVLKILNGMDDGNFEPSGDMTRAQAAVVICKVSDLT